MNFILISVFALAILALFLNRLRRCELIRANKDEALIKRLYSRINELEARCYRLRRERYSGDSCGNPIAYIHSFGCNGQYNFVEWLN